MEKNQGKVINKDAASKLPASTEHQVKDIKKHVDAQVKNTVGDTKDAVKNAPKR